jgi:hypothetical protein
MLHGYINNGRNMYFKDERLDIREVEEWTKKYYVG